MNTLCTQDAVLRHITKSYGIKYTITIPLLLLDP